MDTFTPSIDEIKATAAKAFGHQPCLWQCKVTQAILKRDRDVVNVAPTGAGKTMTFWMPLLFRPVGTVVVITPLNILGTQNKQKLMKLGIPAINIDAQSASPRIIQASSQILISKTLRSNTYEQDIAEVFNAACQIISKASEVGIMIYFVVQNK
ncbi:hypothetical protein NM688_g5124 [Phlebia brevispora]|uniref:Uncharacterized protein n=1 Tax=Phlebia brevispora TaxID=194682 RepID=A0ACC1T018_9APHY|nr:hypothetical protein NM688_g5124 [Phlebia brevispora]